MNKAKAVGRRLFCTESIPMLRKHSSGLELAGALDCHDERSPCTRRIQFIISKSEDERGCSKTAWKKQEVETAQKGRLGFLFVVK